MTVIGPSSGPVVLSPAGVGDYSGNWLITNGISLRAMVDYVLDTGTTTVNDYYRVECTFVTQRPGNTLQSTAPETEATL